MVMNRKNNDPDRKNRDPLDPKANRFVTSKCAFFLKNVIEIRLQLLEIFCTQTHTDTQAARKTKPHWRK